MRSSHTGKRPHLPASRALAVALLVVLAFPALLQARGVKGGEIVVGEGAAGVKLDMKRAEVLSLLGRPFYENKYGFMQYSRDTSDIMFDVYLDSSARPRRVRMIGIAGGDFRIGTVGVFDRGALRALMQQYGDALKPVTEKETGDRLYRVTNKYQGRKVWTDFSVTRHRPSARIFQVFLLFV